MEVEEIPTPPAPTGTTTEGFFAPDNATLRRMTDTELKAERARCRSAFDDESDSLSRLSAINSATGAVIAEQVRRRLAAEANKAVR